jgi:hypothetical protein
MIENKLTFAELSNIISPFLRMETPAAILSALQDVLRIPVAAFEDIVCQDSILVTYEGYRIDIRDIRLLKGKGVAVHIHFKAKQKWWHIFKDQTAHIVRDLQNICAKEIRDLHFMPFGHTQCGDPLLDSDGYIHLVFYHDSRAFNAKWKVGWDISPLLIVPDAHHGKCFVEFQFNPGGYRRCGDTTVLRDDWANSAFDVSEAIERDAKRLLGIP